MSTCCRPGSKTHAYAPAKAHRIFSVPFADIYPLYLAKIERKGRREAELAEVLTWLTGYDAVGLMQA